MIKEMLICYSLMNMTGIVNEENICNNVKSIHEITKKYKIKPELYVSLLWVESNFNKNIKSYTGRACGISQVVPKYTRPKYTCDELNKDQIAAMEQGARIYSLFKSYSEGKDNLNLCAYNQGYRCKGEKGEKYVKMGMGYAKKVKKFQNRLNKQIYKNKINLKAISNFSNGVVKQIKKFF